MKKFCFSLFLVSIIYSTKALKNLPDDLTNEPIAEADEFRGKTGIAPDFYRLERKIPVPSFASGLLVSGSQVLPEVELRDVRRALRVQGEIVAGPFSLRKAALKSGKSLISDLFPWLKIPGFQRIPLPLIHSGSPVPFPRGEPTGPNGNVRVNIDRPQIDSQLVQEIVDKHVVVDKQKEEENLPKTLRNHGLH